MKHQVRVVLSNPDTKEEIDYVMFPEDHQLAADWRQALEDILQQRLLINKSFCFLGFPSTPRNLEYLCDQLNRAVFTINTYNWTQHGLAQYAIEDWFSPDVVRYGPEYQAPEQMFPEMLYHSTKHEVMNRLHNYFEQLQGTVEQPSQYFMAAPADVRKAIGRLNTVCHEIENLVLSQRKHILLPEWTRPVQITTFDHARRFDLTDQHRELFAINGFDRKLGGVYMHWAQIGKTLFEVFRDEHAPVLTDAVCEAITPLRYYSGEFDVEWGRDITAGAFEWHDKQMSEFNAWLISNNIDPTNTKHSLGYLPVANVDLMGAFGTTSPEEIWNILGDFLNVRRIEGAEYAVNYNYTWREQDA